MSVKPLPVQTKKLRAFVECCSADLRAVTVEWIRTTVPNELLEALGGMEILNDMTEEALHIEEMPVDYRVNRPKGSTMVERRQRFLESQRRRIAGRADIKRSQKKALTAKIDAVMQV